MVYQKPWQAVVAGMFIGLESQFLDICKKVVPALHKHSGYEPHAREICFFAEHVYADEIHGATGFAIVAHYCRTPALHALAVKPAAEATARRWRSMYSIEWYDLH